MKKLKRIAKNLKNEIKVYKLVLQDKRTPVMAKILLGAAIGYLLMPFDLIPDFIPVLGQLDDAVIVPGLIYLALKIIPKEIITEHRKKFENEQYSG